MADNHGYNLQYIDEAWTDTKSPDFIESQQSLEYEKVQQLFLGYYFDHNLVVQTHMKKYSQFQVDQITKRLHACELEAQKQVVSEQKPAAKNQQVLSQLSDLVKQSDMSHQFSRRSRGVPSNAQMFSPISQQTAAMSQNQSQAYKFMSNTQEYSQARTNLDKN